VRTSQDGKRSISLAGEKKVEVWVVAFRGGLLHARRPGRRREGTVIRGREKQRVLRPRRGTVMFPGINGRTA